MKFFRLLTANLFRRKLRFLLTAGSFSIALFLFGFLAVLRGAFGGALRDQAGSDRLVVVNRVSIIQPLPIAYRDRILRIPGVKLVGFASFFGGVYQDEKNQFSQFAIDVENQRKMFPELLVPDDQWTTFLGDRRGAIVGMKTAKRFGWKLGDHIPIKGTIYPGLWEFNIDGFYRGRENQDETQFWFDWNYLQQNGPQRGRGQVSWYTVSVSDANDAAAVSRAIDKEFSNSLYETHTDSESIFFTNSLKQFGNIRDLILAIGAVVFFTLLLVTGNTMAIAVRERTGELAILKALGYTDRFVLGFVLVESLFIAVMGGGLGLAAIKVLTTFWNPAPGILRIYYFSADAILVGFVLILAVGTVSGILPAITAMRLRVVDALRRI